MKGPCGHSLRKEDESSGLWGLVLSRGMKVSTDLWSMPDRAECDFCFFSGRITELGTGFLMPQGFLPSFHHVRP